MFNRLLHIKLVKGVVDCDFNMRVMLLLVHEQDLQSCSATSSM